MFQRIVLCILLLTSTALADEPQGKASAEAEPQAAAAVAPMQAPEGGAPLASSHVTLPPIPSTQLDASDAEKLRGANRFLAMLGSGLLLSGGMVGISVVALPAAVILLPLTPFATAGIVTAVGDQMGGEGRYGIALVGSLGLGIVGMVSGFAIARASLNEETSSDDEEFSGLVTLGIGAGLGLAIGTSLGSALGYSLADESQRRRKQRSASLSGGVAPVAHGMLATLAGRF